MWMETKWNFACEKMVKFEVILVGVESVLWSAFNELILLSHSEV